jgi:hypothetical protein
MVQCDVGGLGRLAFTGCSHHLASLDASRCFSEPKALLSQGGARSKTVTMFSTFLMGLASAIFIELGIIDDPLTKKKRRRPDEAKKHIDLLEVLKTKTQGNLSPEESLLFENILRDVKLAFAKESLNPTEK